MINQPCWSNRIFNLSNYFVISHFSPLPPTLSHFGPQCWSVNGMCPCFQSLSGMPMTLNPFCIHPSSFRFALTRLRVIIAQGSIVLEACLGAVTTGSSTRLMTLKHPQLGPTSGLPGLVLRRLSHPSECACRVPPLSTQHTRYMVQLV